MFLLSNRLAPRFAPEGDPSPGGSGAEPPKALTEEDVGRIVNAAVTGHLKRELPKLTSSFADTLKPIQDQLAALTKPAAEIPPGDKPLRGAPDPELAAMRAQHEELKKSFEAERKAREAAETRARNDSTRTAILAAIDPLVRPESKRMVADWLFQNSVEFDENGSALFKLKKSPGAGMPEEDVQLPLEAGVREFLKSKDAEWLIPQRAGVPKPGSKMPQSAAATRGQIPQYDKPATTDEEKVRRAMEREEVVNALNAQR